MVFGICQKEWHGRSVREGPILARAHPQEWQGWEAGNEPSPRASGPISWSSIARIWSLALMASCGSSAVLVTPSLPKPLWPFCFPLPVVMRWLVASTDKQSECYETRGRIPPWQVSESLIQTPLPGRPQTSPCHHPPRVSFALLANRRSQPLHWAATTMADGRGFPFSCWFAAVREGVGWLVAAGVQCKLFRARIGTHKQQAATVRPCRKHA